MTKDKNILKPLSGRIAMLLDELSHILNNHGINDENHQDKDDKASLQENFSRCTIMVDDAVDLTVSRLDHTDTLRIESYLPEADRPIDGKIARQLCEANLFWKDTGGITLGLTPDKKRVMLRYDTSIKYMEINAFKELIEGFINAVEQCREFISSNHDSGQKGWEEGGKSLDIHLLNSAIRV
ncbi:MAG: type III secretion system chaperone [Desulfamplus sp.]|nr:type III secretion system chaperone [Desulfamplus sp.]